MDRLIKVDWNAMFVPTMGLADIVMRGTLMYLALFASCVSWAAGRLGILGRPTYSSSS